MGTSARARVLPRMLTCEEQGEGIEGGEKGEGMRGCASGSLSGPLATAGQ